MNKVSTFALTLVSIAMLSACGKAPETTKNNTPSEASTVMENKAPGITVAPERLNIYHSVELNADLSAYSENQKIMLGLLIDASKIMDDLFWKQAYGKDKTTFLDSLIDDKLTQFADINYGPWDRLNGDTPFLANTEEKPAGAQFYPSDMSKEEFENADFADKDGLYSMVQRNANGDLIAVPYNEVFRSELNKAADLLVQASEYATNMQFANYLRLRAEALLTNEYQVSDFAWMDMKTNPIDVVIGPIETYEDQLFGYRAAFESYVLLKDMAWSERLAKYAEFLPSLQQGLPVAQQYKAETPGSDADLNAYDVIYYAGHSNAGSKTIAINLPNDEEVQLTKGTRRLQLKNAMQAKFEHILVPISEQLIAPEQRQHITFNAFFANTMFHEVAHGLGIKNTINNKGTVRQALKEHASALEEGKADILGLYMITQLLAQGEISEGQLEDYYVTFMAGIFRSVRFGASSAHGKANMVRFNYFQEQGAFERDEQGFYSVNMTKMGSAINGLSELILTLQGNGDYQGVAELVANKGIISANLRADLAKLTEANIPVDITFKQGKAVLGLSQ
ncbi:MAG: Zn-dependent hydrolase [Glaciecola sp.]